MTETWLEECAGDPRALLLLAAACRRTGDLAQAELLLRRLVASHPQGWAAWHELGVALALIGDAEAASRALRRAVELNPQTWLASSALADLLTLIDAADAQSAAARAAELRARPGVLDLALDPAPGGAAWPARVAVAGLDSNDPVSCNLLALAALDAGRPDAAETLLTPAVRRWPSYAPLRRTLAQAHLAQGDGPEALALVEPLAVTFPASSLQGLLAEALVQSREDHRARQVLEEMARDRPEDRRVWIALGHVRKTLGEAAGAAAAYRCAISQAPDSGEAYAALANLKHEVFEPDDILAMRARLANGGLHRRERAHFHFALAKALEEQGDFAGAFGNYREGNALRRQDEPHDAAAHSAFVARSQDLFSAEFLRDRADAGHPDEAPIFVVGLPRAGSTLVEQILACHPDVEGCDELHILPEIARAAVRRVGGRESDYPADLVKLSADDLRELGAAYLERSAPYRKLGRLRFVDKFPGNVLHLGLIALILPHARIVDVRRAPEACCVSLFRQNFAQGQAYSRDLRDLGRYYRDYLRLTDHMAKVLPRAPVRVSYETLVRDPEPEIRRLLHELGLPFDPTCLRPERSRRPVRTASAEQVRRPISAAGLESWRAYEAWLGPLHEGLNETP
jgi:tetratricopeptide (TPR) repeat protein